MDLQKGIKKTMVHFIWHVMTERHFSLPLIKVGIHFGHVRMCATPCPISLIIFILDLGPSYTDKLLEFRWVQIAHLVADLFLYCYERALTMIIKLMLSRLLIPHLGTSMTF